MTQNLQNVSPNQSKMFLFKGKFGTGKSPAAASFPKPLYFFDFDRRMDSVKKMFPHEKEIYYDTFADFGKNGYKKFADVLEGFTDSCPYATIVLPDSITNFVELAMNHFIKLRGAGSIANISEDEVKQGTKKKSKSKGALELLGIDDYSAETRAISEMLSNAKYLADKGVNIITTAHIITTENSGDDFARSSYWMPKRIDWTNRNFYKEISQYFSMVKESPMEEYVEEEVKIVNGGGNL